MWPVRASTQLFLPAEDEIRRDKCRGRVRIDKDSWIPSQASKEFR
jgi:hypothetical protein